jgi:hypothetical protein
MMKANMSKQMDGAPEESMRPKMRPKKGGAPKKSLRPKARPKMIGGSMGDGTKGIPPEQNYGAEDLKSLTGGMPKMKKGGKVRGYGMARGGKVCKMR